MFTIQTGDQNPILRIKSKKVEIFDEKLEKILDEMIETMIEPDEKTGVKGIGLAANQVGINARIIIITFNIGTKKEYKIVEMINPEIIEISKDKIWMEEGCLSVPGVFDNVKRPKKIKVRWQNRKGNICEKKLDNWDARIFQHEYDHLEGILFTDYFKSKI